jgi:hypothetical protein
MPADRQLAPHLSLGLPLLVEYIGDPDAEAVKK